MIIYNIDFPSVSNISNIYTNIKSLYCTPQCKNKANVYKIRGKVISSKVINTGNGIAVKMPSKELSDSIIKKLKR